MVRDDQSGHVARGEFACTCQCNQEVICFVAFDLVASQLRHGFGPKVRKSRGKHNAFALGQLTHINGGGVAATSPGSLEVLCSLVFHLGHSLLKQRLSPHLLNLVRFGIDAAIKSGDEALFDQSFERGRNLGGAPEVIDV
jgi:hypothetical protein